MATDSEIGYNSKIEGDVVVTTVDAALNWFRKNSVWPMPMGLACCAIELMAVGASRFDISRFGSEVMRFSPRVSSKDFQLWKKCIIPMNVLLCRHRRNGMVLKNK